MKGRRYYSRKEYLLRAVWLVVSPVFSLSPRVCNRGRVLLLQLFGAKIGSGVEVFPSATITYPWMLRIGARSVISWGVRAYNLGAMEIGERVVISQHAHLCGGTHDYESGDFALIRSTIRIEDDVWIGADAFIGPGVTIGSGAVVGARAVVAKDVPPLAVVVGNPARIVKWRKQGRLLGSTEPAQSLVASPLRR